MMVCGEMYILSAIIYICILHSMYTRWRGPMIFERGREGREGREGRGVGISTALSCSKVVTILSPSRRQYYYIHYR